LLLKKPIASVILVLAVLIFGSIALERLSIELMPDIARPTLLVRTDYAGAPASEVEFRITEQLEGVLSGVRGVQEIESLSRQSQSLTFLTFEWGFDMDIAFLNVREKLDQARYLLPSQAERPQLIYSSASDEPIATIALQLSSVSNQEFSNRLSLKRWADQVFTRRLEQQEGIAQALLVGEVEPEVQIRFNPRLIDRYGLSLAQIQQKVRDANIFSSPGELRDGWYRYALKIESRIESLDDLRNTPIISLASGRVLLLEEIADVEMGEADPTSFALLDGEEVLNVLVKKEYGSNTVEVFQTLQEILAEIRSQNPDIQIEVIQEDASYIENSISNLLQTLLIGGVLAFLVLFFFLDDARSPFTIGISIPVSIFLTFVVMFLFDIQLNIISLSGLTLGIGLLLDNAIVVLENISRYRKKGLGRLEAAREGTKEISLAVTASTFTTISVFLPLIFLGGFEGAFFRDLAATLSFSLVASLLVALFILPVFVVQLSRKESASKSGILKNISGGLDKVIDAYEQNLGKVIQKPLPIIIVALVLLSVAAYAFMTTPKAVLPPDEPSSVEYLVSMPGNTALRSAKAAAVDISEILKERSEQTNILSLGGYTDNTNLASITNEGLNKFTISIPVNGFDEARQVDRVMQSVMNAYQSWSFQKMDDQGFGAVGVGQDAPVQFSVVGTDRNYSVRVANAFNEFMNNRFGEVDLSLKYPQRIEAYQVQFKPEQLLAYELTEEELIRYLESLTRGSFITDWNRQDEQISIRLIGEKEASLDPRDITLDLRDKIIPLPTVAEIIRVDEPEQIERARQSPILTYNTNLTFMDWWWSGDEIHALTNEFMQRTGNEIRVGGSALDVINLLKELGFLLGISVLLIYLILAIQYENLKYPFIIILAIPFAWIGSVFALWIGGVSLNALSFMGILILTGIAVNDSILKVDFMRRYYSETGNLDEAIKQAGINRFRPVVMTSMTTILALIPMLIPFGDGYAFRQSLAIALMGGMVTSTFLTLYLIPLVFKWTERGKASNIEHSTSNTEF
jgi:HAE1 family hydrophobic/amphiphilic exporter-1|tara:strand:- start:7105 stop:10185 length:3081 start_codon:yes stop_codon:yes gene_type:complete